MRKKIIVLILLLISFFGYSQIDIQLGKPYMTINAHPKYYIKNGDDILIVKFVYSTVFLQRTTPTDLTIVINTKENLIPGSKPENIIVLNNRCYLFFSFTEQGSNTQQLYYREIDFKTATFIGKEKLLLKGKELISSVPGNYPSYLNFSFSPDSSKIMVKYRIKSPEAKGEIKNDLLGILVLNKDLEPVWEDAFLMPYRKDQIDCIDYLLDSEGNVYVTTKIFEETGSDSKKGKNDLKFRIEILRIKNSTRKIEIIPVQAGDNFINTIKISEAPNKVICGAGYCSDNAEKKINGILTYKLDLDGKIYDLKIHKIPNEIINQYESKKSQKNNTEIGFDDLQLRSLILETDGSLLLIGERSFGFEAATRMSSGVTYSDNYGVYNDILVVRIDAKNNLAWMKKLPKRQLTPTQFGGGMSYKLLPGINEYNILFLDSKKNKDLDLNQTPETYTEGNGGFLTIYNLNATEGEVKKVPLFELEDIKGVSLFQYSVGRVVQISPNEFIFEAYKKNKEDILIKVKIQ